MEFKEFLKKKRVYSKYVKEVKRDLEESRSGQPLKERLDYVLNKMWEFDKVSGVFIWPWEDLELWASLDEEWLSICEEKSLIRT